MNPVSVLRVKFVSQNLRYFISFKGIPFTLMSQAPVTNKLKKCFPMRKWKNVKQHSDALHLSQNQYSERGGGSWN